MVADRTLESVGGWVAPRCRSVLLGPLARVWSWMGGVRWVGLGAGSRWALPPARRPAGGGVEGTERQVPPTQSEESVRRDVALEGAPRPPPLGGDSHPLAAGTGRGPRTRRAHAMPAAACPLPRAHAPRRRDRARTLARARERGRAGDRARARERKAAAMARDSVGAAACSTPGGRGLPRRAVCVRHRGLRGRSERRLLPRRPRRVSAATSLSREPPPASSGGW